MRLPQYFGHVVNDVVYDRLAPGLRRELEEKNPRLANGRRKSKHFQWLTGDVGNPRLLHHLGRGEGLANGFEDGDWDGFYAELNRRLPNHGSLPLFSQVVDNV